LQDAQRQQFDVVLAEALDRISRDRAGVATLFKQRRFAGVPIITLSEGEITELYVGLKGTMDALFIKDLAAKTHRASAWPRRKRQVRRRSLLRYLVVKKLDERGEPIRGDREIDETQAIVPRRISRELRLASARARSRKL
jgi:site-specific DNA recombinase